MLGHTSLLADTPWPEADPSLLIDDTVTIAVQVGGKMRGTIELPRDGDQTDAEAAAKALPQVVDAMSGKSIRKVIFVPNRILNFVV